MTFSRLSLILALLTQCLFFAFSNAIVPHLPLQQGSGGEHVFLPFISAECSNCFYVDSISGDDANAGTSLQAPWKTMNRLKQEKLQPGSTIYLKRGSSWPGGLTVRYSGTQDKPILLTAYGEGPMPVFINPGDGEALTSAITIYASWVVLEDVKVQDARDSGVKILNGSDHNIIRGVEAANVGIGVSIYGQYNLVTDNYIHDVVMIKNTPGGSDDYGANGVLINNSNNEVSYNRMERCIGPSYDFGVDGGAIEFFDDANNAYVHHNWAVDSDGFLEVGVGSVKNTVVAYNVSLNNRRFSTIHLTGTTPNNVENFKVENNTIVENQVPGSNDWVMFYFKGTPNQQTFLLRNNIIYLDGRYVLSDVSSYLHEDNLYTFKNGAQMKGTLGWKEQMAEPQFTNLTGSDFTLRSSSPAVDVGLNLGYSIDFTGAEVPVGPAPDLGAFERQ